jgi:hypothetical protein
MGTSHSPLLNSIIKTIWDWCITNEMWLTVARIPGKENTEAEYESRKCRRTTEWCLDKNIFRSACEKLNVRPNIDLFALRLNYQIKPYISYNQDPETISVNAFHHSWVEYQFYAFPPFCLISQVLQKIQKEESGGLVICIPRWTTQSWWPMAMRMLRQPPIILPRTESNNISPKQSIREASSPRKTGSNDVSLIREQFQNRGLSTTATEILEASWRTGTRNQYEGYFGKWRQYCGEQTINPFSPTIEEGINFLAVLYKQGIGYSAINAARSALSSIIILSNNTTFGTHPLVGRFLKGVFESRPALPKHNNILDVRTVLEYLRTLHPLETVTLKMLTLKLTMILALISAQRGQTLKALSLDIWYVKTINLCFISKHC